MTYRSARCGGGCLVAATRPTQFGLTLAIALAAVLAGCLGADPPAEPTTPATTSTVPASNGTFTPLIWKGNFTGDLGVRFTLAPDEPTHCSYNLNATGRASRPGVRMMVGVAAAGSDELLWGSVGGAPRRSQPGADAQVLDVAVSSNGGATVDYWADAFFDSFDTEAGQVYHVFMVANGISPVPEGTRYGNLPGVGTSGSSWDDEGNLQFRITCDSGPVRINATNIPEAHFFALDDLNATAKATAFSISSGPDATVMFEGHRQFEFGSPEVYMLATAGAGDPLAVGQMTLDGSSGEHYAWEYLPTVRFGGPGTGYAWAQGSAGTYDLTVHWASAGFPRLEGAILGVGGDFVMPQPDDGIGGNA